MGASSRQPRSVRRPPPAGVDAVVSARAMREFGGISPSGSGWRLAAARPLRLAAAGRRRGRRLAWRSASGISSRPGCWGPRARRAFCRVCWPLGRRPSSSPSRASCSCSVRRASDRPCGTRERQADVRRDRPEPGGAADGHQPALAKTTPPPSDGPVFRSAGQRKAPQVLDGLGAQNTRCPGALRRHQAPARGQHAATAISGFGRGGGGSAASPGCRPASGQARPRQ